VATTRSLRAATPAGRRLGALGGARTDGARRVAPAPAPACPTVPTPGLGDDEGVRAAYRAHGGELLRFATQSLQDRGLAEEAVQETFVRAWRNRERFDPAIASLRTWLFAILRNVIIDLARARAVRPTVAEAEGPGNRGRADQRDPVDATDSVITSWQLAEALARLSDEHRVAIVETHYRGRPYGELAAELGIPVGTLRSRVFYGLRALRVTLEEMGWTA
jgi:RNA polymerase sigma-70 factor (ECF subfamily)